MSHQNGVFIHTQKRRRLGPKPFAVAQNYPRNLRALRNILLEKPLDNDEFEYARFDLDHGDGTDAEKTLTVVEKMEEETPRSGPRDRRMTSNGSLDIDFEIIFSEILSWLVSPGIRKGYPRTALQFPDDNSWIYDVIQLNWGQIIPDLRECRNNCDFATHWKIFVLLEVHASLREELLKMFPTLRDEFRGFSAALQAMREKFLSVAVKKIGKGRLVVNFKCFSVDPALNIELKKAFSGMVIALGFFGPKEGNCPPHVHLLLVRSAHVEEGDALVDGSIARLDMRIVGHRASLEEDLPKRGEFINVLPLMQFSTSHRAFRAVHEICHLPMRIQQHIFGRKFPQLPGTFPSTARTPRKASHCMDDVAPFRSRIYSGCIKYIDTLAKSGFCNEGQIVALLTVLNEVGQFSTRSGSLTLIHGPPGTGKTRVIVVLIGCLFNSSTYGYLGTKEASDELIDVDGQKVMRGDGFNNVKSSPTGPISPVRILVCAPTNAAADKICEQIHTDGILNVESGEIVHPEFIRVGKDNHDYKALKKFSLEQKVSDCEKELESGSDESTACGDHAEGKDSDQASASGDKCNANSNHAETETVASDEVAAKATIIRKVVGRAVVFISTNSTAGSSHFRDLKTSCNFIIMDEAANCSEPDSLVPISSAGSRTSTLHVVLVGDHKQLGVLARSRLSLIALHRDIGDLGFNIDKVFRSLFERMFYDRSAASTALTHQFRTHPHIGSVQTPPFYDDLVKHPDIRPEHLGTINQPNKFQGSFCPLTVVDTSTCKSRYEVTLEHGQIINRFEAKLVNDTLFRLYNCASNQDDADSLVNQIAILSPYRAQIGFLEEYLEEPRNFVSDTRRKKLNILIATVDQLQGSERDVVIISFVRSNRKAEIGFLNNNRRMNVATSRSRKLLILIGDSTTLSKSDKWLAFWRAVTKKRIGTNIEFAEPSDAGDKFLARAGELSKLLNTTL